MADLAATKSALRRTVRQELRCIPPEIRSASDDALLAAFLSLPQLAQTETVLLFYGVGREPDTARLFLPLHRMGKCLCLPRCLPGSQLEIRAFAPGDNLIRHPYGMLEPDCSAPLVSREKIGLALIPALCCDRQGYRLGQGGGFYDRFLPGLPAVTVCLCRDALLQDALPLAEWDRPVDIVVTEKGVISHV